MKRDTQHIFFTALFFTITTIVIAQPAPPAPTDGDPIVGIMGGMSIFIIAAIGMAIRKKTGS